VIELRRYPAREIRDYKTIGQYLRHLRKQKGLSIVETSFLTRISPFTIQRWELDKYQLNLNKLKDLCKAYDISFDEAWNEIGRFKS
jgi:transcriptional regulator with XRE-family HTH domain